MHMFTLSSDYYCTCYLKIYELIFAFSSHPFLTQPIKKHYFVKIWTGRKERAKDGGQWFWSRLVPGPLLWSFLEALPQTNGEDVKLLVTMAMCELAAPFTFISILVFLTMAKILLTLPCTSKHCRKLIISYMLEGDNLAFCFSFIACDSLVALKWKCPMRKKLNIAVFLLTQSDPPHLVCQNKTNTQKQTQNKV